MSVPSAESLPTAVLAADLHILGNKPICRTDDYIAAQWNKLKFISDLCKKYDIPLLVAGDLGDKPIWTMEMICKFSQIFSGVTVVSVYGNHDLPSHNISNLEQSGIGVLEYAGVINNGECGTFPDFYHYGEEMDHGEGEIAVTHQMVLNGKEDYVGQKGNQALSLLKSFPGYRLILTGDNHIPFVIKHEGRLLVNPGSMMRNTIAQESHKPRVYLWYRGENEVIPVYLPIEDGVISREHVKDRSAALDKLREVVQNNTSTSVDFRQNMSRRFDSEQLVNGVKSKILKCMEN
jgi:DNA repair exonuclease SbcCD nuclease subunit